MDVLENIETKLDTSPNKNGSKIKVAILGDHSTQLLVKALRKFSFKNNFNLNLYEGDYDSINMELLDQDSGLYLFDPDYIVITLSTKKLQKKYYKSSFETNLNLSTATINHLEELIEVIQQNSNARVLITNYPELPDLVFCNYGNKFKSSWIYQLRKINFELMNLSQKESALSILDISKVQTQLGFERFFDAKMYAKADMFYGMEALPIIAKNIVGSISAIEGKFKKCLILDLDNTVWGGVIGDDGLEKIEIGDVGLGKVFTEFQSWAKKLKERGIILCICSKNTNEIAIEPFEKHPDMVIRMEDISVFVANWENKADNIKYIQGVLNIGFDSMVFLDDNPFERNLVRQVLPEVTVPELPKDPAEYLNFLQNLNLFETASFSSTDSARTKQYQQEAERLKHKKKYSSISEYLENLQMLGEFESFDSFSIPRVAQLTQRSNQFNLRTIRYTEHEVEQLKTSEEYITRYLKLSDKYGDHGLISVLIVKILDAENCFIDTWLMSCRVLKRDVEKFVLNELVDFLKKSNFKKIKGEYIPTKKNKLVENHYADLGFVKEDKFWILDIATYSPFKNYIKLK